MPEDGYIKKAGQFLRMSQLKVANFDSPMAPKIRELRRPKLTRSIRKRRKKRFVMGPTICGGVKQAEAVNDSSRQVRGSTYALQALYEQRLVADDAEGLVAGARCGIHPSVLGSGQGRVSRSSHSGAEVVDDLRVSRQGIGGQISVVPWVE